MLSFRVRANLCRFVNAYVCLRFCDGVMSFRARANNMCMLVNVHDYRRFCDDVMSFRTEANLGRFVNVHDYLRFVMA